MESEDAEVTTGAPREVDAPGSPVAGRLTNSEIQRLSLEACDEMTSASYEWPVQASRGDIAFILVVSAIFGVIMYWGFWW